MIIHTIPYTRLGTALAYIDCYVFSSTHFIIFHLVLFYFILRYSFMFNPIFWIIPKKFLIESVLLLFRFSKYVSIFHNNFTTSIC